MTNANVEQLNTYTPAAVAGLPSAHADSSVIKVRHLDSYNISRQELKILHGLTNGDSNKVIAHHLGITEATVKVHVRTILRKLGTTNRTKAAVFAISQGFTTELKLAG